MKGLVTEEHFHENLDIWSHKHPREAVMLPYVDCEHLTIVEGEGGQLLLEVLRDSDSVATETPEEIKAALSQVNLDGVEVLYVYGVGLGYAYELLKGWLEECESRHLVFLEDDLAVVHRLLQTERGGVIVRDRQVHLHTFKDISDTEVIFNELFWLFPMTNLEFMCSPLYHSIRGDRFEQVKHQILYDASLKNDLLKEYLDCGAAFFHNFYSNILKLPGASLGSGLFGQFKGVPAIICGAGPSLKKNIEQLKGVEGKAVIFGGSSSLNALTFAGVTPNLGAGIDPNKAQEERLQGIKELSFPFIYRNRLYPGALALVKGPRLYMPGAGGYDIAEWFEEGLGIANEGIEEGNNVVNFCLEIASAMGCDPIIFVGMDLAFTGMENYASGVVEKTQVDRQILSQKVTLIEKEDIYGKPITTLWKWVSEAKWIGDFADNHPEVTVVNATEGGLGFPGVRNMSLKDVSSEFLKEDYMISSRICDLIQKTKLEKVTEERVRELLLVLKDSLKRCIEGLAILSEENDKLLDRVEKGEVDELAPSPRSVLVETELSEEPAFAAVLQIFSSVNSRVLQRDVHGLIDPSNPLSEKEKEMARVRLNQRQYAFLAKVAQVNSQLIDLAMKNH